MMHGAYNVKFLLHVFEDGKNYQNILVSSITTPFESTYWRASWKFTHDVNSLKLKQNEIDSPDIT